MQLFSYQFLHVRELLLIGESGYICQLLGARIRIHML